MVCLTYVCFYLAVILQCITRIMIQSLFYLEQMEMTKEKVQMGWILPIVIDRPFGILHCFTLNHVVVQQLVFKSI